MILLISSRARRFRKLMVFLLLPVIMIGIQACTPSRSAANEYIPNKTYPIDKTLKDFYDSLDGENLLGAGLSPLLNIQGDLCQYTVNAMLCFDPEATGIAPYYLMPLGEHMDITEKPAEDPPQENAVTVDGYVIYPDILPLYQYFGEKLYAGSPITNAFYNPSTHRIEQYFENLGFYFNPDGPGPKTGLIAIGQEVCRQDCPKDTLAIPPANLDRANPLTDMFIAIDFLGGETFFGKRLTDLSIAPDGYLEMVYEKAAFYAPVDDPRSVQLRELPATLGIPVMAPGPQVYDAENGMDFHAIEGDLGYHVPLVFETFLNQHGGFSLSGQPIGDPAYYQGTDFPRQCFQFICLEYHPEAETGQKVILVDLGTQYLQTDTGLKSYTSLGGLGAALQTPAPSEEHLTFKVSEKYPQVRRSQVQTIEVFVFDRITHQPVENISATLLVTRPDGSHSEYAFPPSGENGKTRVSVEPIEDAVDGTLVSYRVCLTDIQVTCLSEAYLIWGD